MSRLLLAVGCLILCVPSRASAIVDQDKIKEAIKKGIEYLRVNAQSDKAHGTGAQLLAGLALLEGGVPASDPTIQGITGMCRETGYGENNTYNLALSILYLDKLNDPADVPMLQLLGCRLLAGQSAIGGWGYVSFPSVPDQEQARLRTALRPTGDGLHPEAAKLYKAIRSGARTPNASDDNSNTQFAIVGLWVANRRGVPCSFAFRAIDGRFLRTQSPVDHGWGYNAGQGNSTPAMTCAGLLGLAVGKAAAETRMEEFKPQTEKPKERDKEKERDPFFNPPESKEKPKEEEQDPTEDPDPDNPNEGEKKARTFRDFAIERALKAMGALLGNKAGAVPAGGLSNGWGGLEDLYFIWSLERVAVGYGLNTIGDVDWYDWGATRILATQQSNGAWKGSHSEPVETSFALLFLLRANFTGDLTRKMDGKVKDPGAGELRGSRGGPLAIQARGRLPDAKGPADPNSPDLNKVRGISEADKVADDLLKKATDAKWQGKLNSYRDAKGGPNTVGLALAIPLLSEKRQLAARDALADRLARLTASTLSKYLTDRDPEIRRAACLAVGMKDEKKLTLELIERVTDIDDGVVRAARATLKAMYERDFGPVSGANDDRKRAAYDDWRQWYTTNPGGG